MKKEILFMKEIYVQAFKQIKEYPANFFSIFYLDITIIIVYLIFYSVFQEIANLFLDWTYLDFILFLISISLITKSMYFFIILGLKDKLLSGELNIWRCKPIHPFIGISSRSKDGAIYTTFIFVPFLVFFYFYGDYQNSSLGLILLIFSLVYYVIYIDFLESIAFFIKENTPFIRIGKDVAYLNEKFTPKVFENTLFSFLFYLPTALFGYFFIEFLNGREYIIVNYLHGILISFLLFLSGTFLLWHYGLKKYEAFG
jgi:hypothetical protein